MLKRNHIKTLNLTRNYSMKNHSMLSCESSQLDCNPEPVSFQILSLSKFTFGACSQMQLQHALRNEPTGKPPPSWKFHWLHCIIILLRCSMELRFNADWYLFNIIIKLLYAFVLVIWEYLRGILKKTVWISVLPFTSKPYQITGMLA